MENLQIAVCDDQPEIVDAFSYIIKERFAQQNMPVTVSKFNDPVTLAKALRANAFDLLFLDIDMPKVNGIALAKKLREIGDDTDIIYVSNKEDMVFKVFDVHPFTFIRKSHFFDEIGKVIRSYIEYRSDDTASRLIISDHGDVVTIDLNKTVYFESVGKIQKACMSTGKGSLEIKSTMKELEDKLVDSGFVRVHRGFLVNYQFIDSIKDNAVVLTTGVTIPLSRRNANEVKDKFLTFIRGDKHMLC